MSRMQSFRNKLFQSPQLHDPLMQGLAQLTQADLEEVVTFKSDLDWTSWGANTTQSISA